MSRRDARDSGELEGFHATFTEYFPRLRRFFLSRGFSAAEADDLSQTTLWNVYRSWGSFRGEGSLESWIYAAARNAATDEIRRGARRRETDPPDEELAIAPSAETDLAGRETAERLAGALRKLPTRMRACLLLRVQKELPYREIARRLGISEITVKVQIWLARKRLREAMETS
ncbi:MAG TPA: sigma-70 family RNA polymerase sigma factor [Thermoanaerobaculia bacterium]|nr:sigma-70 family RNA polymerase sigma factor [Thermoanaerobaculia bacterium]